MLAGCSGSALISPRHRLRSEASAQFPSMSTQRLDLPCSFPRKDTSSRSQSIRPVGISLEKPIEAKTSSCSIKQSIRLPPLATTSTHSTSVQGVKDEFWEKGRSLKRFAEQGAFDEACIGRAKRKKSEDDNEISENMGLGQLGKENFWYHPSPQVPFTLTTSGEEEGGERVCFVPSEVISPPMPMTSCPWVESIVTEITDFGQREAEGRRHRPVNQAASPGSSSSSESHQGLALRLSEHPSEHHEVGNGSGNPQPQPQPQQRQEQHDSQGEHQGFELVNSLVQCVEAVYSRNIPAIHNFIARLGELASPRGSPIARLAAYYTEALALRVARVWPNIFHITPPREIDRLDEDSGTALRLLNQVSPIPKFIHFTANEILLRAFEGKDRVHIIDFDIKQGLQWPSLFQSLASRPNPPSHVRITGIGESKQELLETRDRLAGFAEALNLPFEFHPVVDRLEDVRLWMLHVKEKESVAVNCMFQLHKTLYDASGRAFRDFVGLIRSTNPTIVVMAEQEAEHNDPMLESRFCKSIKYYSALFDLLDSSLPLDSPVRIKIEEMFAREIRNIIACEGSDRHERHLSFTNWKQKMEQGGLRCLGVSDREVLQSQLLLKMYSSESYGVKRQGEGEAITLSWLDQPLYTVSAWTALDSGSSSSVFPQQS